MGFPPTLLLMTSSSDGQIHLGPYGRDPGEALQALRPAIASPGKPLIAHSHVYVTLVVKGLRGITPVLLGVCWCHFSCCLFVTLSCSTRQVRSVSSWWWIEPPLWCVMDRLGYPRCARAPRSGWMRARTRPHLEGRCYHPSLGPVATQRACISVQAPCHRARQGLDRRRHRARYRVRLSPGDHHISRRQTGGT